MATIVAVSILHELGTRYQYYVKHIVHSVSMHGVKVNREGAHDMGLHSVDLHCMAVHKLDGPGMSEVVAGNFPQYIKTNI